MKEGRKECWWKERNWQRIKNKNLNRIQQKMQIKNMGAKKTGINEEERDINSNNYSAFGDK